MIDRDLLAQLGWSKDLINAAIECADSLRQSNRLGPPTATAAPWSSVTCTSILGSAVVNNTPIGIRLVSASEQGTPSRAAPAQRSRPSRRR
jgi:hypothetical protein